MTPDRVRLLPRRALLAAGAMALGRPLFARITSPDDPSNVEGSITTMAGLVDAFAPTVRLVTAGRFVEGPAARTAMGDGDLASLPVRLRTAGSQSSVDGSHGYSFGYITAPGKDGRAVTRKYVAYWLRTPAGWRIALFKRGGVGVDPGDSVPTPRLRSSGGRPRPAELVAREALFAGAAAEIGLQAAFRAFGSDRAVNVGGGPAFTFGAEAISREVAGSGPPARLAWGADGALVAGSGDLGVTWGYIRDLDAKSEPSRFAYFTIWGRERGTWLYIAE